MKWFHAVGFVGLLVSAQISPGVRLQHGKYELGTAYLTHITTDKPIYRAGEKLYVRGVVLHADGHSPLTVPGAASFQIKGPKGDVITSGSSPITDSVVGFSWEIPAGQAGGEHTVRITHPWSDASFERKFDIRAYRAPRLKSQIVFVRDGYGPGDTVTASVHVERAEGGLPIGAKVSVSARIDGQETWKGDTRIDATGNASTSFRLPATIVRGEGVLAMIIQDGGTVETAAKTIPILLQTIDLAIYPEGGDLIAGLPNRVYVEGRTPAQKPADMAGTIVNASGKEVATFRTEHEGRGRFLFIPAKGEAYSLRISEPAGIKTVFPLPDVKESGVALSSISDIAPKLEDVALRVAATTGGAYDVVLSQRGKELSFKRVWLHANQAQDIALSVPRSIDGVITATIYDDRKVPLAERLLFRQPDRNLNVKIVADREDYAPGEKVTLRVTTTDETGKPVGAMVGLAVTDSSVLEMIEKREQAPRLPVMVLFENEVRNLADAHVYLDETNPKAPLATDLLLGTQGWRRFATVDAAKFIAAHGDAARRALAIRTPSMMMSGGPFNPMRVQLPAVPVVFANAPAPVPGVAPMGGEFINGVVTDVTGARIPGTTVQATNTATGVIVTRLTNEAGAYVIPSLLPGTYDVTAALPGFRTTRAFGLRLLPETYVRQDFPLEIASVNTQVEVTVAADTFFATTSASVGAVLPQRHVLDLPLVGRNVLNPDLAGDVRLLLSPVDAELGRGNGAVGGRSTGNTLTIREFAHAMDGNRSDNTRTNFEETVYWSAGVRTDAMTGRAAVSFGLSDSVTSFRVIADGFTFDGALGSSMTHVESVKPFSIEPKMPLQVTGGDVIHLPVGVINGSSRELRDAELNAKGGAGIKIARIGESLTTLDPKERTRGLIQVEVAREFRGVSDITLDAKAGRYRDSVSRKLDIQPLGFPYEMATGGLLDRNSATSFEFTLPAETVRGSVTSSITVYPTPLASMTDALKALIQEPYGCFEQTSSTSYPMTMAQQYFLTHSGVDPDLIDKTRGLLDKAYKRLLGFEAKSGGFEVFGGDPGHAGLTAYGLLQFTDMAKVRPVDKAMLTRTRAWLMGRRDGQGRFRFDTSSGHGFGSGSDETTSTYIVWALVEAGEKQLDREVAAVKASARSSQDSYLLALGANILHATGDKAGARELMDRLAKNQDASGYVKGAVTSATHSGGEALKIETSALAALAWMREPAYAAQVEKSVTWIAESNRGGRFGSTQSTILALRSIIAYDAAHAPAKAPGRLFLTLDGKAIGTPLVFTATTQGALILPQLAADLGPGKHTVALKMEDGAKMPFSISVKYNSALPDSDERTQVGIQVALKDSQLREGEVTEATVSIINKRDHAVPTPLAIVGIPAGLEVRHDQLKEIVKSGKIDAYEVIGREVILYWRHFLANKQLELPLSLVAAVPGSYTGPASRAYLYYTDEYKNWAPGVKVNIEAR
jgi:hypothetical protein